MATKFKKEKYISQQQTAKGWRFRVKIRNGSTLLCDKTFHEADYGSAKIAYEEAKQYRNLALVEPSSVKKVIEKSVQQCFDESFGLYPLRKETVKKLYLMFYKFIHLQSMPISEITAADIQMSLNEMIEIASDDSIARVMSIWRRIYQTALVKDYITKDQTLKVVIPKSHYIRSKRTFTTSKQILDKVIKLLSEQKIANKFDNSMIIFALQIMYYTGLRPCECFALNKEDLNLFKREISITKELGSSLSALNIIRPCKTEKSYRTVPICDNLYDILIELKNKQPSSKLLADHNGNYFNTTTVGAKIRNLCRRNNIEFNMYQLRHQFSTDLITNHVDVRTVMELMGHNNSSMTIDYARSSDDLKIEAIKNRKLS